MERHMRVLSMRLGEGYAGMYCTLSNLELVLRHSEKKTSSPALVVSAHKSC